MVRDANEAAGWRGGAAARPATRYEWKPGAGPGRPAARAARLALLAAALACAAAFVYLLFLLARPPRPYFVLVAADPAADALHLDAPLDLLGWRSATHFRDAAKTRWGAATTLAPLPDGDDPETLAEWLAQFRPDRSIRRYGPVVMYFGVHAGVARAGGPAPEPVLFAGRGKPVRL
ncbi:hypothetical protein J0H58_38385, partial [bacterium]|nr:hypothetical protein [bacterium]